MARTHVLQGLATAEAVAAGQQVEAGVAVPHGLGRADLHAAHRVDRLHEAGEVDLQVVVDLHPGHVLHGPHGQVGPTLRVRRVQPHGMGLVGLARDEVPVGGHLGVAVAGQADHTGALLVRRQVHEHDRVRAVAGRAAQPVLALLLRETFSRPSVPTSRKLRPCPACGRFFMSLNGSTRSIPVSRPVITACPTAPEPSTATDRPAASRTPTGAARPGAGRDRLRRVGRAAVGAARQDGRDGAAGARGHLRGGQQGDRPGHWPDQLIRQNSRPIRSAAVLTDRSARTRFPRTR